MEKNQTILITGGTGSFGKKFAAKVLEKYNPKKVIIFSRDEMKQWEMSKTFTSDKIRFFIGDMRDKERLSRALMDVDCVIHAAALKIVPTAEYNPIEYIKTNVIGAMNLIDAAINQKVKKIICLSTDKACNPINLYGASKLAADKLFIAANNYSGKQKTIFSIVRYGNVMSSRGSMMPFFLNQKKENKNFTLTDNKMTRFLTTLDDAADAVLLAYEHMVGGEIFVKKNKSISVLNFLNNLDKNRKIKIIGIRPGEKINETLITSDESSFTYDFGSYYKIIPAIFPKKFKKFTKGAIRKVKNNFSYSSDTNNQWFSNDEIKKIILNAKKIN
jgi:UDP-N-acetylglucosamine 4,6-dehydratase (inverting)